MDFSSKWKNKYSKKKNISYGIKGYVVLSLVIGSPTFSLTCIYSFLFHENLKLTILNIETKFLEKEI